MHVSDAVVDCLAANGIDTVFGIPGTQTLPLNQNISGRDDIRFVMARHETAVSHQAWGYAETSGRPAATAVIPGPGDLNAMNGLKNALNDCTPLVHLSVETEPDVRGGDGIHETPPETYDTVVKENVTVTTPESAVAELERAIAIAQTPPKGPVRVGIPINFLSMDVAIARTGEHNREGITGAPPDAVREAADALAAGEAPVIVAGGGVRAAEASAELKAVAETLDAPVVPTFKGKGVFPEDHELFAGVLSTGSSQALFDCIADSDVALGVGTDFDAVTTQGWTVDVPDELIHITLHERDLGVRYEPTVGIVADAKVTLTAIDDALDERDVASGADGASRARAVRETDAELMADVLAVSRPPLTSASAEAAVRDALPRDAIVTADAGGFRIWSLHVIESYDPHGFVDTGSWASMGVGLPAAIGAKLANPDRDVVSLTGEGGLMMCMHELHTAAVERIPVVVVVLNNDDYATISWEAASSFGFDEGAFGWEDVPVDFSAAAESMGVRSVEAETPAEIEEAVTAALGRTRPTLIEVPTDPREPQTKPLREFEYDRE